MRIIAISLMLVFINGCASSSSGSSSLTADRVNQIEKGVTTKTQVEAMFGPPANVTMLPGGKRVMIYNYSQSNVHTDAQSFIPIAGMFLTKAEGQTNTRSLQVNLDANNVVEDYEFNDNTNNIESNGGVLGSSVKSTPVPNTGN